jgi:hypothetical protein
MCVSAVAGFTTAPPYDPECRSVEGPSTSIWKYASPRSDERIDGMPGANLRLEGLRWPALDWFCRLRVE